MAFEPNPPDTPKSSDGSSHRGNVVATIAIAILAVVIFFIVSGLQKHNAVQNCIDSGRRDCVPLSTE